MKFSQANLTENERVTSLLINHPKLLLRKKQDSWPEGRTSYRFKNALRRRVTIIGKTSFNLKPDGGQSHLVEKPKPKFVGSEMNYKETVDEDLQDE